VRIDVEQRRARLARRHHLAAGAPAEDVARAARDLVAMHSTDAASVYLGAWARVPGIEPAGVQQALYEQRTLVRMLGMRRTVFVVAVDLAAVVHAACTRAVAAAERKKLVQFLAQSDIAADPAAWLREAEEATVRALAARGEALAVELSAEVPQLKERILLSPGTRWEGWVNASTRVLFLLAADGRIVRGRPRGSWISSQYRWAPAESWLPGGIAELPTEPARVSLVRHWLRAYGPATAADLAWWTGWTAGEVRRVLREVAPAEVELAGDDGPGGVGLVLADDVEPEPAVQPWAALLPALDSTPMGWRDRRWFLGEHGPALFDRSGNVGPTVWWDGRIVGGWAQRRDGEIAVRLLEDIGAEATAAVRAAADRLAGWLGDARVTPRFRTPLERELSG
jgi:Winged helix DNA-binding domain